MRITARVGARQRGRIRWERRGRRRFGTGGVGALLAAPCQKETRLPSEQGAASSAPTWPSQEATACAIGRARQAALVPNQRAAQRVGGWRSSTTAAQAGPRGAAG